jgi:pimeloyl-ACP methyl ester carboxylesterase
MPAATPDAAERAVADGPAREPDRPGRFAAFYDRAVERLLDVPVCERWLDTPSGTTHLLTAGDPDAPPVVVFQGGNVTAPVTLAWVQDLAADRYLIAPDTAGEPGVLDAAAPADYGAWAASVLDALDVERAAVVGISHGAGVALELAAHAPERISAAALVVPAGFGMHLSPALARVVLPALAYRVQPDGRLLAATLRPLLTEPVETVERVVVDTIGTALRMTDLAAEFPGPENPSTLAGFDAPVLVLAAEHDPFFPGAWLHGRAASVLPGGAECVTLADERHLLSPAGQAAATDRIREFLTTRHGDR